MSSRKAFVEVQAMGASWIVNRFDYNPQDPNIGVGIELLNVGQFEPEIFVLGARLIKERKERYGQGVVVIDGGANMGVFSVLWASIMHGDSGCPWGAVVAFEPQRWPYQQLCGNICKNNCYNVRPIRAALSDTAGEPIKVPDLHPLTPQNFGGVSLINYQGAYEFVDQVRIDDYKLTRLDLIKLDLERMEPHAIRGAVETLERCKPVIITEILNCGIKETEKALPAGYRIMHASGVNALCAHNDDETGAVNQAIAEWKRGILAA